MKTLKIEIKEPIKLLELIEKTFPESSRSKQKEILAHRIYIASRHITQYDFPLAPGMKVTIEGDEDRNKLMRGKMPIVYEDRYLMVVDKPEGLLSNSVHPNDRSVISELNEYFIKRRSRQRAHIVHRLDRDTSGLLLVAKSKDVARELEHNWKERVFDRAYVAVCWGAPIPAFGTVKSWLTDGEYCVESSMTDNGGKLAITHYKTVKKKGRFAMVQLTLETGRRNQIRVHMRDMGHPLLKDPIYGYRDDDSPISRLALHAFRLCFYHPVTGKEMRFETPYPAEFNALFDK
jgi:23S rRNA pseudouridine1911/1915/1917 synthase